MSPPKLKAIEEWIKQCLYFQNQEIEVVWLKANSWISDMPLSLEENILWAKNRAKNAKLMDDSWDFYIWMEGWTTLIWEEAFLFWVVCIIDKNWKENIWISNMMKVPKIFKQRLYENGEELWPVLEEITWVLGASKKSWAFWAWSDDMITRSDQFKLAFLSAIPYFYNIYYK